MTFNVNIPQPNDLLSNSQGQIKDNFSSSNISFGVNHYPFNDGTANNGKHKFVDMPSTTLPAIIAGDGAIYTKVVGSNTQLFYTPDATGTEYQLTNTAIPANAPPIYYTFLPGNIAVVIGSVDAKNGDTINWGLPLTTLMNIQTTAQGNSSSGTNRALVAQPRSVNAAAGTFVLNLQDVNNNDQTSNRTIKYLVMGII